MIPYLPLVPPRHSLSLIRTVSRYSLSPLPFAFPHDKASRHTFPRIGSDTGTACLQKKPSLTQDKGRGSSCPIALGNLATPCLTHVCNIPCNKIRSRLRVDPFQGFATLVLMARSFDSISVQHRAISD